MSVRKKIIFTLLFIFFLVAGFTGIKFWKKWRLQEDVQGYVNTPSLVPRLKRIKAVRMDPSFYYIGKRPSQLARELAERWSEAGINLIFFRAYDPLYGAFYHTNYLYNKVGEFGKYDLLKHVLKECTKREIKVFAWLPVMNHQGAWEKNPDWRKINSQGKEYTAPGLEYPLCSRNPEALSWWLGFIKDLLENYPALSGIDLAEPVVSWKEDDACYCRQCLNASAEEEGELSDIKAHSLTKLLNQSFAEIHKFQKQASLTFVAGASSSGEILSWEEIKAQTGFDLISILENSKERIPDFLCPEFIWQEWKSLYDKDDSTFSPEWSASAFRQLVRNLDYPIDVIPHLELTDFPGVTVSPEQLAQSIQAVLQAGAPGFDIYSSSLLDKKESWGFFPDTGRWYKLKSCLVLYDPGSNKNDAIQTGELLRHFKTRVELKSLEQYSPGLLRNYDHTFYVGGEGGTVIPVELIKDIENLQTTFCWLGLNLDQLLSHPSLSQKLGLRFKEAVEDIFVEVKYKQKDLPKKEPWTQVVEIINPHRCRMLAEAYSEGKSEKVPYAVRSGRFFWFFADLPTAYAVEGGKYLVFADLLHDILNENHLSGNSAMVRIEDVHPLTDPGTLKKIADFLYRQKVSFQVAITPFYVNPEENLNISLSERPALISALKHMVRKGGTLIMHGVTHQRFLETTTDYEFWDPVNDGPVQGQTKNMMRQRIEMGLRECWKNDLYPLIWETPHYAAPQEFYSLIAGIFSLAMERKQTIDKRGTDQYLPYGLLPDRFGQLMIPENLGYVPLENPDPDLILKPADKMKTVRDGVASFFFHPFVDLEVLKTIVRQLKKDGFEFTNAASLPISVKTSFGLVENSSGLIKFVPPSSQGRETSLYFPGILREHKKIMVVPGEEIEKMIDISRNEIYALNFAYPLEEELRRKVKKKDAAGYTRVKTLSRVSNYQGESAEVPFAMLLYTVDADKNRMNEIQSFESVFRIAGISLNRLPVEEFIIVPDEINLLIIPEASAIKLQDFQIDAILKLLEEGEIYLITSGESPLSDALGIDKTGRTIQVSRIEDLAYPDLKIKWSKPVTLNIFEAPGDAEYIYRDKETENPLLISSSKEGGKFLYSGPLFDAESSEGISRYPHFLTHVFRAFNFFPLLRGRGVEVFFNPSEREDIAVEELIKFWRRSGVSVIHASAWHFYPEWTYDYERLISLAHENSMLVYAWLEPPLVHEKFWLENPEWREKNAEGNNPGGTWRYPIALGVSDARREAIEEWRRILETYDWDGVTVNRLGFEAEFPPDPGTMTPFHPAVRQIFETENGFDPVELFNRLSPFYWGKNREAWEKYLKFRLKLSEEFVDDFLVMFEDFRKKNEKYVEIILTYNAGRPDSGVSLSKVNEIKAKHDVLWQIIPESGTMWLNLTEPFDIVQLIITSQPGESGFIPGAPTSYPSGAALYQRLREFMDRSQRYIIFSETSLYEVDTHMLPLVLSSQSYYIWKGEKLNVHSDKGGEVLFAGEEVEELILDGRISGSFYKNRLLVPSGEHSIEIKSGAEGFLAPLKSKTRIVDFSGNLKNTEVHWRGISLDYQADKASYLVITDEPLKIILNGKEYDSLKEKGQRGWVIYFPPGRAKAEIITRDYSELFLSILSLSLSNFIVLISALSILCLLIIFLTLTFKRVVRKKSD